MRLTCPCCGATLSLEALLNDLAARQAVATALSLPADLGPRLLRYLGLFRPAQRSLTWERAAHLLSELHGLIDAGEIRRHGRPWRVTAADWASALDEILDRRPSLTLPLKSHGYLLEILAGLANQTEARHEQQREEDRRQPRPDTGSGMQSIQALMNNAKIQPKTPDNGSRYICPSNGAMIDTETGEIMTPQRPNRIPPPAEFRDLASRLRGLRPEHEPDPAPETPT